MGILRTLARLFRRRPAHGEAYEAEVLFSGWVELPPLFRETLEQQPPPRDTGRALSA